MQGPILYPLRAAVYKTDCSLPDPLVPSVASTDHNLSYSGVGEKCHRIDGAGVRCPQSALGLCS
jgi:hypothetical protein